jgi:hypothetical protein
MGRFILVSLAIGYGLYTCWGLVRVLQLGEAINEGTVTALGFRGELFEIVMSVIVTGFCLSALIFPILFGAAYLISRLRA